MYVLHKNEFYRKLNNETEKSACDKHHYIDGKIKKFIIWTDSNKHHNGRFRKIEMEIVCT